MNPIQIFYNNPYFENLQETEPFREYLEREEQKVKEVIRGGKILDVGCGNGRSTQILSKISNEVVGIDFSERLLGQAQKRCPEVRFYLEDAKSTHFDNGSFDYVVMLWNTFGNLYSSRNQVLREVRRIVKPDGKVLMSVLSENVLDVYFDMLKQNELVVLHQDENYIFLREGLVSERFSKEKLEEICRANGLTPRVDRLTDISYWCEAQK
jgi:ubiquinone/menaquinone biosynthesis C-methylase UbiE